MSRSNGYSACALLVIGVLVFVYRQDVSFQVGRAKHHLQASERTPLVGTSSRTYTTTVEIKDPKKKKQEGASLFKVLARTYGPDFLKAWGCKFIYDLLQMASPSLLRWREFMPAWFFFFSIHICMVLCIKFVLYCELYWKMYSFEFQLTNIRYSRWPCLKYMIMSFIKKVSIECKTKAWFF